MIARTLLAVSAAVMLTLPAAAHSKLKSASPPKGAEVTTALSEVRLVFNETLEAGFSSIKVQAADETVLAEAPCAGDTCVAPLKDLKPGKLTVLYDVLSADGHKVKGGYEFTVKAE